MHLSIPGFGTLDIEHVVLDFNGTIAEDGELLPGVAERMRRLAETMDVVVITADTHGTCAQKLAGLPCRIDVIKPGDEARAKLDHVQSIGAAHCAALGNGANDTLMLEACALGIAVMQAECACARAVTAADMVATDICHGLDLLLKPARLLAGLRS